jgi:hypothetical protein
MTLGLRKSLRSGRSGNTLQTLVWFGAVLIFTHSAAVQLQADEPAPADSSAADNSSGGNILGTNSSNDDDTIDYCLDLHAGGANLISFYALPEDASLSNVMASLVGNATGITGEGVAATYIDDTGWVGSLTTVSPLSGYWLTVSDAASLCLSEAIPTDPRTQYQLHTGNNLVSFPYRGTVNIGDALPDDVEEVITGITGEGVAAVKLDGQGWVGSLTAFEGGKGYWIKTTDSAVLVFNVPEPAGLLLMVAGLFVVSGLRRRAQW